MDRLNEVATSPNFDASDAPVPLNDEKRGDVAVEQGDEKGGDSDDLESKVPREQVYPQQPEVLQASDPPTIASLWSRKKRQVQLDAIATQPSVFDNPELAPHFQPPAEYENYHRFDPNFRWTWAEEIPLVKRIDWKVTAWACIAFFALDLDRGNISQANTDNFLKDLGMNTNDFNLGNTVFRLSFLLAELPSQLVSKKIGPDRWVPVQMILWSIVSTSQFWLTGRKSFLACRALIGLLQGGFVPDVILYLSYFYKGTELPFRCALFWIANRMTDVVASLLAFGLLRLRGYHGYEGWRWLFLVEGLLTLCLGIWSVFAMVPSPTQTKARWRPKGWFTEHEEKIMVNRILRDDPSKSDMHNREAITLKLLWESLCDYDLWPIYAIALVFAVPGEITNQYLTLTLRNLKFDTFQSNLLSIPCQVGYTINVLIITYLSDRFNQRALAGLFNQFWFLPCVVALALLPASTSRWGTYALLTVILSYPSPHPVQVGWCSRNSNAVRTRAVSAALYNMAVQLQIIITANIYRADDAPLYRRGNRVLIGIVCLSIVLYVFAKWYYVRKNRKRDKVWNAMSEDEKQQYLNTTHDEAAKRLDFRFAS